MKKLPKNCLTCKFMEFADDELEGLRCFCPSNNHNVVEDTYSCDDYIISGQVVEDAKQGCW